MATKRKDALPLRRDRRKQVKKTRPWGAWLLGRGPSVALGILPPRPRKLVKRIGHQLNEMATSLKRRGMGMRDELDDRRRRLAASAEHHAANAIRPLQDQLGVASRTDLEHLRKRIARLERQVRQTSRDITRRRHTVASPQVADERLKTGSTESRAPAP